MAFFRFLICVPFMLAGVYLSVSVLDDVDQSLQARNWPTVTGRLTSEPSSRFRLITPLDVSTGGVSYNYSYQFDGVDYQGRRVGFGVRTLWGDVSIGMPVVVYVNPDQPLQAVLVVGVAFMHLVLFFAGIGMVVIGVMLWRRI